MSIRTTRRFLDEHARVRDHVERLPVSARELARVDPGERIEIVERIVAFLAEVLLPHAAVEQRVLYPEAAALLGEPDASEAVARDREQIRDLLECLAATDTDDVGTLQEILFAVHALLLSHVWREEELYVKLAAARDEARADAILALVTDRGGGGGRFLRGRASRAARRGQAAQP